MKFEFSANGTSALNESKPKAQPELSASGTCRALSENEPEAKFEFSANGTSALNESKAKAQPEFSASGTCRALSEAELKVKDRKGEHDEQRTGKDLRPKRNGRSYL